MNWDLHFSYGIPIGGFNIDLLLDIFNIFDEQVAVEVDQRWTTCAPGDEEEPGCSDINAQTNPNWGDPQVYAPPQSIRLGLKFSW
jgi:outer membrane receptor protein involved in Fe transport